MLELLLLILAAAVCGEAGRPRLPILLLTTTSSGRLSHASPPSPGSAPTSLSPAGIMQGPGGNETKVRGNAALAFLALGLLSGATSLPLFGFSARVVWWREQERGVRPLSYFLAATVVSLVGERRGKVVAGQGRGPGGPPSCWLGGGRVPGSPWPTLSPASRPTTSLRAQPHMALAQLGSRVPPYTPPPSLPPPAPPPPPCPQTWRCSPWSSCPSTTP